MLLINFEVISLIVFGIRVFCVREVWVFVCGVFGCPDFHDTFGIDILQPIGLGK